MKRVFLVLLVCVFLHDGVTAQTNNVKQSSIRQQEGAQKPEAQSPELFEAEKLNLEVVKLYKEGKFDDATPLAKRVLQIRDKALAPGHDLINSALINLGEIYRARRKYGEAKTYFQRLLTNYEQAATSSPAAVATVLDILGFLNYMDFEYDDAEKSYQRALALREGAGETGKLEVATSLFNLAEFYRRRGESEKAEPLYQRAIEIRGNALGANDKDVVKALERYSCLYYSFKQPKEWRQIRKQFAFLRDQEAALVEKGEILNGKAISLPKPKYPVDARRYRITATVVIKVIIDEAGKVVKAEDMCGAHPLLVAAAAEAAYGARFTPTLREGVPEEVSGVIVYRFVAR